MSFDRAHEIEKDEHLDSLWEGPGWIKANQLCSVSTATILTEATITLAWNTAMPSSLFPLTSCAVCPQHGSPREIVVFLCSKPHNVSCLTQTKSQRLIARHAPASALCICSSCDLACSGLKCPFLTCPIAIFSVKPSLAIVFIITIP